MNLQRGVMLDSFEEYLMLSSIVEEYRVIVPEEGPGPVKLSPMIPDRSVVYGPGIRGENVIYCPVNKEK